MTLECKNCSMHEQCICEASADECEIRKQSYNKAVDDFYNKIIEAYEEMKNIPQMEKETVHTIALGIMEQLKNKYLARRFQMKNISLLTNILMDIMESEGLEFERINIDDGATEEAEVHYHIKCPYLVGDERALCHGCKLSDKLSDVGRDLCVKCKFQWLLDEVDK
jgi:hypothetical protein|nr:MAG TPA: hypothetical protein [Bacteriophage sp.]